MGDRLLGALLGGLLGGLALASLASRATAQTVSPCDSTPVAQTITSPAKVGICFNGETADGAILSSGPLVFKIYLDSNLTPSWTGSLTAIGSPTASGYSYYETPVVNLTNGSHTVKATVSLGGVEGLPSLPLTVTAVPVPPGMPVVLRLVK